MFPSPTHEERRADWIIHAIGLAGFSFAIAYIGYLAIVRGEQALTLAVLVYAVAVLSSISISFAYHLSPRHDLRPILRRWDHAAIYAVIAGTFSPLLVMAGSARALMILAVIWVFAVIGVTFKFLATEIDTRWSVLSYLGLGWMALVALPDFWIHLPRATTAAIAVGGLSYSIGTMFYRRKGMRFRYPIWHAWGTLGGASFCTAIWLALNG